MRLKIASGMKVSMNEATSPQSEPQASVPAQSAGQAAISQAVPIAEQPSDAAEVARAARLLHDGGLVAFPTETVYGLGADVYNELACRRIYNLKGRNFDKPLSIACSKKDIMRFCEPDFFLLPA